MDSNNEYEYWVNKYAVETIDADPIRYIECYKYNYYPSNYKHRGNITTVLFYNTSNEVIGIEEFETQKFIRRKKLEKIL